MIGITLLRRAIRLFTIPTATLSYVRLHTVYIWRTKVLIVLVSILLLLLIIVWPLLTSRGNGLKLDFESVAAGTILENPSMQKPRLYGVDEKNQPYTINAEQAIQLDERTVQLKQVSGVMNLAEHAELKAEATEGQMHIKDKLLELSNGVTLQHSNGYTMQTQAVQIDLSHHLATGNQPVTVDGPMGHVAAERFVVDTGNNTITFSGNVRVQIQRQK